MSTTLAPFTYGDSEVRVRDLVWLTFGTLAEFEARVHEQLVLSGWYERFEEPS